MNDLKEAIRIFTEVMEQEEDFELVLKMMNAINLLNNIDRKNINEYKKLTEIKEYHYKSTGGDYIIYNTEFI
jgi:hypothetical protein